MKFQEKKPVFFRLRRGLGFTKALLILWGIWLALLFTQNATLVAAATFVAISATYFLHSKTLIKAVFENENQAHLLVGSLVLPMNWQNWQFAIWKKNLVAHRAIDDEKVAIVQPINRASLAMSSHLKRWDELDPLDYVTFEAQKSELLRLIDTTQPEMIDQLFPSSTEVSSTTSDLS